MHEPTSTAINHLGSWVSNLTWGDLPTTVQQRHQLIWADYLTVASAGAQLPEYSELIKVWPTPSGPAPIPGTSVMTSAEVSAWIVGATGVALEQDEGNKFAKGHPAAHVIPAVMALAFAHGSRGIDCATAVAAGYEVAARFGRATSLAPGVHPHGNWGVAAAAAGCARLLGLDASATAAAIDHGSGMAIAGHFSSAIDGNLVRNSWMGASALSGIASAYLAAAGIASNSGTANDTLGSILGTWDSSYLTDSLGSRWDCESNYFKIHAACAFTHPPIDAMLQVRTQHPKLATLSADNVLSIDVYTHYLAAGLNHQQPASRLSAMFSIPFVIAVALRSGEVTPRQHGAHERSDPDIAQLAERVQVHNDPELSNLLPHSRAARVRIELTNGEVFSAHVPNPIGDSDFAPLGRSDLEEKGARLIQPDLLRNLWTFAEELPTAPLITDLASLLRGGPS